MKTAEVLRKAWEGITVTKLAGGVLKLTILRRGKRTPQDRGAATFVPLAYDVFVET